MPRYVPKGGGKYVRTTGRRLGKPRLTIAQPSRQRGIPNKGKPLNPFKNPILKLVPQEQGSAGRPIQLNDASRKEICSILRLSTVVFLGFRVLESTYPGTSTVLRKYMVAVKPGPKMQVPKGTSIFLEVKMSSRGGAATRTAEYEAIEEVLLNQRAIK